MSLAVILALAVALAIVWRLLRLAIRVALLIALIAAVMVSGTHLTRLGRPQPTGATTGRVIGVIDGDTLTVGTARGAVRARLLGVDAPEGSALRYGRPDCGGQAATDALRRVAQPGGHGVRVRLVTDPRSGDVKDAFGRILAYVDGPHGDLGEAQLRAGQAVVYRYRGRRFSRLSRHQRAQAEARAQHRGAWAACHGRFHAARP